MQNELNKINNSPLNFKRKVKLEAHVIAWEDYNIAILKKRLGRE